jgi:hypothetical protein
MCGIVGTFGIGDVRIIEQMLAVTTHRGEDSTRHKVWPGRCGLGINRLSIVDLHRGEQPLHFGEMWPARLRDRGSTSPPLLRADMITESAFGRRRCAIFRASREPPLYACQLISTIS